MPMVKQGENEYRILLALAAKDRRFSELMKEAKKASLSKALNELEGMRYITRNVSTQTKPPTTTYRITRSGLDFLRAMADVHIRRANTELERWMRVAPEKVKAIQAIKSGI